MIRIFHLYLRVCIFKRVYVIIMSYTFYTFVRVVCQRNLKIYKKKINARHFVERPLSKTDNKELERPIILSSPCLFVYLRVLIIIYVSYTYKSN